MIQSDQPMTSPQAPEASPATSLLSLNQVVPILERALETSPADHTELIWFQCVERRISTVRRKHLPPPVLTTSLLARVRVGSRVGVHHTDELSDYAPQHAIRQALGHATMADPGPAVEAPGEGPLPADGPQLSDREIEDLRRGRGKRWLLDLLPRDAAGDLEWLEGRVAVVTSSGLRRQAHATCAQLYVTCGRGPLAGRARGAARTLQQLAPEAILERARSRQGQDPAAEVVSEATLATAERPPTPTLVLAAEANAVLVSQLNQIFLSSEGFRALGPRNLLGQQLFDRSIHLRDDGTDPRGLPFPFDLAGRVKVPVDLVREGVLETPALDDLLAADLERPPTPHALGDGNACALNLFLEPGTATEADLLAAGEGGIWMGDLDSFECFDLERLAVRLRCRWARRIRNGRLAEPVVNAVWEGNLLEVFKEIRGLGDQPVCLPESRGLASQGQLAARSLFGGISAPAIALAGGSWVGSIS